MEKNTFTLAEHKTAGASFYTFERVGAVLAPAQVEAHRAAFIEHGAQGLPTFLGDDGEFVWQPTANAFGAWLASATASEARIVELEAALREARDTKLLDYLQDQVVDTIYMDDGNILDVQGGDLRKYIASLCDKRAERYETLCKDESDPESNHVRKILAEEMREVAGGIRALAGSATPSNASPDGANMAVPRDLMQRISHALHCADVLVDAVPTRLQNHDDSAVAHIGELVNEQDVYHVISDAKRDLYAFLMLPEFSTDAPVKSAPQDTLKNADSGAAGLPYYPDLTAIINWLEGGCDPQEAVKELRYHQGRITEAKKGGA